MRRAMLAVPLLAVAVLGAWRAAPEQAPPLPTLRVVKSASCGCCQEWVKYMQAQGFTVKVENREGFTDLKRANGVTAELESCHTAFAGNLVIEGHVPADLVKKVLATKPKGVKGLAAPGMPMGSPGMEQGGVKQRYTVYAFDATGKATPYAVR